MRILYLLQFVSPSVGGGEALFYNLAQKMVEKGHEVNIICYKRKPSLVISELTRRGVKIHSINPEVDDSKASILSYGQHIKYILNALGKGYNVIRNNSIDIIHANTYTPIIPAFILGKILRVPVITTVHHVTLGHWKLWAAQEGVPNTSSYVGPIYERFILKLPVQMVHVVSDTTKKNLIGINQSARICMMYNGIDLEMHERLAEDYGFKRFILFIGRLVSTKNLEILILALKHVILNYPDVRLVVVGGGPMRNKWEQMAVEKGLDTNITFMGPVSEDVKYQLLCSCTALVLPSKLEGFGRVIIEAFAMSKPVLVSDIQSLREVVDDGRDGFLISPDDIETWANRISYLLANTEKSRSMGISGRMKAEEKFDLKRISDRLVELYKDIISDSI